MVPLWFRQKLWSRFGGSTMALLWATPWVLAALLFAYGALHLHVLADWVGYVVDEGFTAYGAQRLREGQVPHRDFFFLWTPGILFAHAALQELGASAAVERALSLLASVASAALVFRWGIRLGLEVVERWLLAAALCVWSFSLWNVPYSSWLAIALALAALEFGFGWRAGLLFALSFWFKQNIGLLAAVGAFLYVVWQRDWRGGVRMAAALAAGIALPFAGLWVWGGRAAAGAAFYQIFFFPFTYRKVMATMPLREVWSWASMVGGVWLFSLYLGHSSAKVRLWSRSAALAVVGAALARQGREFLLGVFFFFSCAGWLISAVLLVPAEKEDRRRALYVLLPAFGAFLQVYPRLDFQHFLFSFPLAALALAVGLHQLRRRYPHLPRVWSLFPMVLLVAAGIFFQGRLLFLASYGMPDRVGFVSYGESHRLNQEMAEVRDYLLAQGLPPGGPVLVMPNATSFYRFSGFRNPTPHDQFFPAYVESFGAREEDVLENFEAAGGQFVVLQHWSGLARFAPVLERYLSSGYQEMKRFPYHFSVWRKRPPRGIDSP